jgi:hypothetical protein
MIENRKTEEKLKELAEKIRSIPSGSPLAWSTKYESGYRHALNVAAVEVEEFIANEIVAKNAGEKKIDDSLPRQRLAKIAKIIFDVEERCLAADGDVQKTLDEMTQAEISEIYSLASITDSQFELEDEIDAQRSCFSCNEFRLCYMRHRVMDATQKFDFNIDGDNTPGKWIGIFDAVGRACLLYKYKKEI